MKNYYCGYENDKAAYDAREKMIEETTPEPTPQNEGACEWSVFRSAIWTSEQATS